MRRHPLFSNGLNTPPEQVLGVDSLHTIYLGVAQRIVSASVWRVILSNPWNISGPMDDVLELTMRRIAANARQWFEDNNIPHDRRVSQLTLKMFGDRKQFDIRGVVNPILATI